MSRIALGDRVKDKISGLSGICIGITDWIYGCRRVSVQPEQSKDGVPVASFCGDEPQFWVVDAGVITATPPPVPNAPPTPSGGPRPDPSRY